MAISKIILNGDVQMDVTQDTVTASTLMSGETAHDASGTQITGTASGGGIPFPVFDVTWDDNWIDIVAVTCDKTFAECATLTNGEDHRAVAYEHDQSQTYGYYTGGNNDTYRAQYIKYTFGQAGYDLLVNSNGTITWNYPSSDFVTAGTPTATKGSVSNHSVSVTPSVTNPYGYIAGGTITGSPVSVSASELVSGTLSITSNGTHDVTNYASATVNVSGGGGDAVTEKQVNFIDYDGTLLHSYTKSEAEALTALPSNPTHSGLVAQGWNWTLAEIKAQLTAIPDGPVWVGQMYITESGDTELDCEFPEGRLSPIMTVVVNGTVTIDWGDNTAVTTVTGTSLSTRQAPEHTYAAAGAYTIKIHVVSGSFGFYCSSSYTILRKNTSPEENRLYAKCIEAIRLGSGITYIGDCAFYNCGSLKSITLSSSVISINTSSFQYCYSLKSITIPRGVTMISNYAFGQCYSLEKAALTSTLLAINNYAFASCFILKSVTIPDGVTSIGQYAFRYCEALRNITLSNNLTTIYAYAFAFLYSLVSATIRSSVTSIGNYAFQYCNGVKEYHLLPTTPPTLGTNAFYGIPSDCIIYVPAESLEDYQTATNWSTYASYMVGE